MRVIRSQVNYVNSLDRNDADYINNFTITYPNNFIPVHPNQYVKMSLLSFSTYNYFFWTNRYNNAFNVDGVPRFLPIGFFTPAQNMAHFVSLMADKGVLATLNPDGTYHITSTTPFILSFEGRQPTYLKINSALLLGFNIGGNYPYNLDQSQAITVPYFFEINSTGIDTPAQPISGKLQNIILQLNAPPQNIAFDVNTGYLNYSPTFAYIPADGYAPFDPIVYTPQDTNTWTWMSPSQGLKLGTIRYVLLTPAYQELPMVADYTMAVRIDIMVDDDTEMLKLTQQSLYFQKLLLLQADQHHEDAMEADTTEAPPEPEPPQEETQGVRMTEDQLHAGKLDYYGNNLFYD